MVLNAQIVDCCDSYALELLKWYSTLKIQVPSVQYASSGIASGRKIDIDDRPTLSFTHGDDRGDIP